MDTVKGRCSNLPENQELPKTEHLGSWSGMEEKTQRLSLWTSAQETQYKALCQECWRREAGTWPLEGPPCSLQVFGVWDFRVPSCVKTAQMHRLAGIKYIFISALPVHSQDPGQSWSSKVLWRAFTFTRHLLRVPSNVSGASLNLCFLILTFGYVLSLNPLDRCWNLQGNSKSKVLGLAPTWL